MDYFVVAVAGFFGAVTRAYLSKVIKVLVITVFPLNTLLINLSGCFILSIFMTLTLKFLKVNPRLRLTIGTGFLGAYTTFSTFTLDSVNLLRNGYFLTALSYILLTSLGCLFAAWLGVFLSHKLIKSQSE